MYDIAAAYGEYEQRQEDPHFFDEHYIMEDKEWLELFLADKHNKQSKRENGSSS